MPSPRSVTRRVTRAEIHIYHDDVSTLSIGVTLHDARLRTHSLFDRIDSYISRIPGVRMTAEMADRSSFGYDLDKRHEEYRDNDPNILLNAVTYLLTREARSWFPNDRITRRSTRTEEGFDMYVLRVHRPSRTHSRSRLSPVRRLHL